MLVSVTMSHWHRDSDGTRALGLAQGLAVTLNIPGQPQIEALKAGASGTNWHLKAGSWHSDCPTGSLLRVEPTPSEQKPLTKQLTHTAGAPGCGPGTVPVPGGVTTHLKLIWNLGTPDIIV
jgi:hypothetical protein